MSHAFPPPPSPPRLRRWWLACLVLLVACGLLAFGLGTWSADRAEPQVVARGSAGEWMDLGDVRVRLELGEDGTQIPSSLPNGEPLAAMPGAELVQVRYRVEIPGPDDGPNLSCRTNLVSASGERLGSSFERSTGDAETCPAVRSAPGTRVSGQEVFQVPEQMAEGLAVRFQVDRRRIVVVTL